MKVDYSVMAVNRPSCLNISGGRSCAKVPNPFEAILEGCVVVVSSTFTQQSNSRFTLGA